MKSVHYLKLYFLSVVTHIARHLLQEWVKVVIMADSSGRDEDAVYADKQSDNEHQEKRQLLAHQVITRVSFICIFCKILI